MEDETVAEVSEKMTEKIREELYELQEKGVSPELKTVLSQKIEGRPKRYLAHMRPEDAAMTVHPSILSHRSGREKSEITSRLDRKLQTRPHVSRLYQTNILRCIFGESKLSLLTYRLQITDGNDGKQTISNPDEYSREMNEVKEKVSVKLEGKISERPTRRDLRDKNIIKTTKVGVDPRLISNREQLKNSRIRDSLNKQLAQEYSRKLQIMFREEEVEAEEGKK